MADSRRADFGERASAVLIPGELLVRETSETIASIDASSASAPGGEDRAQLVGGDDLELFVQAEKPATASRRIVSNRSIFMEE